MRSHYRFSVVLPALLVAHVLAACMTDPAGPLERGAEQAVAGPGGVTVTPRTAADQLAVSWSADAAAVKYFVFRSQGGASTLVATIFGPAPSTSYVDTGLSGGTSYCYAIQSSYPDGTASSLGAAGCGATSGSPQLQARHIVLGPATLVPLSASTAAFLGTHLQLGTAQLGTAQAYFPVSLPVGCTISGWDVSVQKGSAATAMTATLQSTNFTIVTPLSLVDAGAQIGTLDLASGAISVSIDDGLSYSIVIARSGAAAPDLVYRGGVAYSCP